MKEGLRLLLIKNLLNKIEGRMILVKHKLKTGMYQLMKDN